MVDAREDLAGAINHLIAEVAELRRETGERKLTASAAARALGYAENYFHGRPWRIPGFGSSGSMHALAEWRAWIDRPEAERRAEWDSLPIAKRKTARGVA